MWDEYNDTCVIFSKLIKLCENSAKRIWVIFCANIPSRIATYSKCHAIRSWLSMKHSLALSFWYNHMFQLMFRKFWWILTRLEHSHRNITQKSSWCQVIHQNVIKIIILKRLVGAQLDHYHSIPVIRCQCFSPMNKQERSHQAFFSMPLSSSSFKTFSFLVLIC